MQDESNTTDPTTHVAPDVEAHRRGKDQSAESRRDTPADEADQHGDRGDSAEDVEAHFRPMPGGKPTLIKGDE